MIRRKKRKFFPPPEQLTNLHPELSFKTRPMRVAKATGFGKLPEAVKIPNEERKMGLEDKRLWSQNLPKLKLIVIIIGFGILVWIRSSVLTMSSFKK